MGQLQRTIDPTDVALSKSWGMSQGRRIPSNSKAAVWVSYTLEVIHIPTNVRAFGQVEEGSYSKAEMLQLRQQLYHRLVRDLERKVSLYQRLINKSAS